MLMTSKDDCQCDIIIRFCNHSRVNHCTVSCNNSVCGHAQYTYVRTLEWRFISAWRSEERAECTISYSMLYGIKVDSTKIYFMLDSFQHTTRYKILSLCKLKSWGLYIIWSFLSFFVLLAFCTGKSSRDRSTAIGFHNLGAGQGVEL